MEPAAHLEGVMNGTFQVVAGLDWNELTISTRIRKLSFLTLIYRSFVSWFFTLLAIVFGTSQMTPLAGAGNSGSALQESIVAAGLAFVGLSMVFSLGVIVYGQKGKHISNTFPNDTARKPAHAK